MSICRICGEPIAYLETVQDCRNEQLSFKPAPFQMITQDVSLYYCKHCKHAQCETPQDCSFYEDYSPVVGAAQYYGALCRKEDMLKRLYDYVALSCCCAPNTLTSYYEIGCGAGDALKTAEKLFSNVIGIEPAGTGKLAEDAGYHVIRDFFSESLGIRNTMHAFSAFQVFEHLEDPLSVLRASYAALVPNGIGLINVPNGATILHFELYHQVVGEHINYYSPESLMTLATRAGFEVLEIQNDLDTNELNLFIRKPDASESDATHGANLHKSRDRDDLAKLLQNDTRCAIWGAGAKATLFCQLLPPDAKIAHYFDSDSRKYGLYTSGISAPIEAPSTEAVNECDTILVFAAAYTEEIIETLRETYGYQGAIVRFDKRRIIAI